MVVALVAAVLTPARAAVCDALRCSVVAVPVPSGLTVPDDRMSVLLPASYAAQPERRYPVLYLLGGGNDTFTTWLTDGGAAALTSNLDLIVVMPDGGHYPESGWYSDWKDGSRQWETFHADVLVHYVDDHYRTLGDGHRAVAGLSMGGFGAMKYAARHPGLFAAAASFSGALDMRFLEPVSGVGWTLAHPFFGTPDDRVWGNQVLDEATWRANNPADLAPNLRGTALFIACGNGFPGGAHDDPSNPGAYFIEGGAYQQNLSFVRALDAAGVPHTDWFYGPGAHTYAYWHDDLAWALPKILNVIK
jgi:S-formylglutathione hydrolase FrmB